MAHNPDPVRMDVIWDEIHHEQNKSRENYSDTRLRALLSLLGEEQSGLKALVIPIPDDEYIQLSQKIDEEANSRKQCH